MKWQNEHISYLRKAAFDGDSAAMIAKEMNVRFGTKLDRNAIIGAAHRQGIRLKCRPGQSQSQSQSPPRFRFLRLAPRAPRKPRILQAAKAPAWIPGPSPRPPTAAVAFMHCTIVHLTNATCRWPVCDRTPAVFCGSPTADLADGVPYCRRHSRMAYA